ncbi:Hypothetical protein SMAX5B_000542 [Scophthalmus maximus]|uniref:Uncharacterized protein n=1 Tax=Scophthalmus maximus TaxID=52904 RepID=A0A2U9BZR8_SCOMX|nr:Hypothetical protein SMAX5B_000542 [Scophthalmus maximus]
MSPPTCRHCHVRSGPLGTVSMTCSARRGRTGLDQHTSAGRGRRDDDKEPVGKLQRQQSAHDERRSQLARHLATTSMSRVRVLSPKQEVGRIRFKVHHDPVHRQFVLQGGGMVVVYRHLGVVCRCIVNIHTYWEL